MGKKELSWRKREQFIEDNGVIFLDNVSKVYSKGAPAINGITLGIGKGEFVFIVGDSGSGKVHPDPPAAAGADGHQRERLCHGQRPGELKAQTGA